MFESITARGLLILLALLIVVNVVTVIASGDESSLTVANLTEHYVHIFIENEPFLYIAPEHSVTYSCGARPTLTVASTYAPGQGVSGSAADTIEIPYVGSREGCSCEGSDSWGDCIYEPAQGGSARIELVPDDFQEIEPATQED